MRMIRSNGLVLVCSEKTSMQAGNAYLRILCTPLEQTTFYTCRVEGGHFYSPAFSPSFDSSLNESNDKCYLVGTESHQLLFLLFFIISPRLSYHLGWQAVVDPGPKPDKVLLLCVPN